MCWVKCIWVAASAGYIRTSLWTPTGSKAKHTLESWELHVWERGLRGREEREPWNHVRDQKEIILSSSLVTSRLRAHHLSLCLCNRHKRLIPAAMCINSTPCCFSPGSTWPLASTEHATCDRTVITRDVTGQEPRCLLSWTLGFRGSGRPKNHKPKHPYTDYAKNKRS